MATLYVTEIGTQVRKVGERLVLVKGQEVLEEIPLPEIDQVVMMGQSVSLTTAALFALTRRGVDIVYLTGAGRRAAHVMGPEHKHGRLRHMQSLMVAQPENAMALAGAIVQGKINNQRTLVRRHTERAPWAAAALAGMDAMAKRINQARTLDELRGLEGQAAKEYFSLFRRLLARPRDGADWGFERRAYYPPTDPINAMLSFGYTLLLNDMVSACTMVGLDAYLGCFHAIDYGRPSMALDLIEEFRPVIVDSLVLDMVNHGQLGLHDFQERRPEEDDDKQAAGEQTTRPIYLTDAGRKKFLTGYAERVNELAAAPSSGQRTTFKRMFQLQAQATARVILGETNTYVPLMMR